MSKIEHSLDVNVPVREAYDQWTQFEAFPRFMDGIESVRQLDATHLHWVASLAGKRQEWDAEITDQTPDQRIAWTSTSGDRNAGSVDFHRVGEERTRVTLTMDVQPSGALETVGDALGIPSGQVKGDLERFKQFVESRGAATGAWRGEVEHGEVTGADALDREPAGVGSMGSYGAGSDLYSSAATPSATADDPYGLGTDSPAYGTDTASGGFDPDARREGGA